LLRYAERGRARLLVPAPIDGKDVVGAFRNEPEVKPGCFIELGIEDGRVVSIRDFRYRDDMMKAWQLDRLGGRLRLDDVPMPEVRPGSVLVRMQASVLMTYMKPYVEGLLPVYKAPKTEFTPGSNGVGIVTAVGKDVWHVKPGQRVVVSSHLLAGENVEDPAQFLLGVTAFGPIAEAMQADWPNGTLAEYALLPKATVTPVEGLDHLSANDLAVTMRFIVPFGGLLRGRLAAGETLVVVGAAGAYGSAAVQLGVAMGAERIVAAGRSAGSLQTIFGAAGPRVVAVALQGDAQTDASALREACHGGSHIALDMVGGANDANSTLAALRSLHRNGRLVLMGSMSVPIPISYMEMMSNNWEILGNFMYPAIAYQRLLSLIRGGLLDLRSIQARPYPLDALPAAMDAAASARSTECIVVTF
jgi:alcohol dehydrogenase